MAKKKDTLKDLNEFMKNQPATSREENKDYLSKEPTRLANIEALKEDLQKLDDLPQGALNEDKIADFILNVAKTNDLSSRQVLYRVCEKVLSQEENREAADILLENLILYLRHQDLVLEKIRS